MALDSVVAIKVESVAEGGSQNDTNPTELSPRADALTAAGLFVQSPAASASDKAVLIDRPASALRFTDATTQRLLSELITSVSGGVNAHNAIRDVQHFLGDEGPGDGFASGCSLQRNFSGPLLTSEVWFTSAAQATKIVSKTLAYAANSPLPSTITWVVYNAAGAAIRTVQDTLTYTGPLCTGISRAWS